MPAKKTTEHDISNKDFIVAAAAAAEISKPAAKRALNAFMANVAGAIIAGERVYFREFGTMEYKIRNDSPRRLFNIMTRRFHIAHPTFKKTVKFKPSKSFMKKFREENK